MFRRVQNDRDIVLVDQRGTGKSNVLDCKGDDDDSLAAAVEPQEKSLARLKACMAKYDADLTQYTTPIAMDDLDDVRAFLGYDTINVYGGSYGTRAALVYMRQHGDRLRSVVLDGVAPMDMRLPLYFPRDSQRAFDLLVKDCAADAGCNKAYPNLGARAKALMERLEKNPPTVKITHPRTGETGEITIDARTMAGIIVFALYIPTASALVPAIIDAADRNDFQSLMALGMLGDGSGGGMAIGMQLSVICAEDSSRYTDADLTREAQPTLFGKYAMQMQAEACKFWPKAKMDPSYYEPVKSAIPTLVMSGQIDPITPPPWGESVARNLSNSTHVIIPGAGHTAGGTACGQRIIAKFIEKGSPQDLDISCAAKVQRPPFFVTPAGPDPSGGQSPSPADRSKGEGR
jgi:pimeloyl-ACP methyl ester carboxylesterase